MRNFLNTSFALLFLFIILTPLRVEASHALGADITYTCTGPNTYNVVVSFYRDCYGIAAPTSVTLYYEAPNCGLTGGSVTLTQSGGCTNAVGQSGGQQLPGVCGSQAANTTCNGGTYPGVEVYAYCGTVTLPSSCNEWIFSYGYCCRNQAVTNLASPQSYDQFVYATVNNTPAVTSTGCNNSPIFTNNPSELFCQGFQYCYNHGVVDFDGDSLAFSLINPLDDYNVPIGYNPGLSPTNPMDVVPGSFSFDPSTGQICFEAASAPQGAVITMMVEEYRDINGVPTLVGSTIRDIQFQVLSSNLCSGGQPTSPQVESPTGAGLLDSISVQMCPGNVVTFDVVSYDPNGNNITMSSNVATAIPGATFTTSPSTADTFVIGSFSWQPDTSDAGLNFFTVTVTNDACPIPSSSSQTIKIFVYNEVTIASSSPAFCGDSVRLSAIGGATFHWTPSTDMSNPDSAITYVAPTVGTWYTVTTDCGQDSIFVDVTPPYTLDGGNDTAICLNNSGQLNAVVSGPGSQGAYGPMSYSWSPSGSLYGLDSADRNSPNPVVTPDVSTTYYVTVQNSSGCIQRDTVNVNIAGAAPVVLAVTTPDTVCPGGTVQLDVSTAPTTCGPSTRQCITNTLDYTLGTGTSVNTNTGHPNIYGHWYKSGKTQLLFQASELQAMGLTGGTISEISFDIASIPATATTSYCEFSIKLGCTGTASLTGFESGLTQVLNPATISIAPGWNKYILDVPYSWDGVSNLVVEVCYNNISCQGSYTYNAFTYYSTTTFNSYVYDRDDYDPSCANPSGAITRNERPNTRFGICQQGLAPGSTVSWTPSTNLTPSGNISNPLARVFGNTTFLVDVDEGNGCIGQSSVNVYTDTSLSLVAGPDTSLCNATPVTLTANPIGSPSPIALSCGPNGTPCGAGSNSYDVGTASASSSTFSPYGSDDAQKIQMLFTTYELGANGLGMTAGIITQLSFNVSGKNSTGPYNNFTISMSCSDSTSLNGFTSAPLSVVYGPTSVSTAAGWNNYTLDAPFDWDGFSNIIIEVTWDNGTFGGVNGDLVYVTSSLANTVVYQGMIFGTLNPPTPGVGNSRPDIRITQCPPPPGVFVYQWTPPTGLTSPTTSQPTDTGQVVVANPGSTVNYAVEVTDGSCVAYDTVTIDFYNDYLGNISGRNVGCFGNSDGDLVSTPSGGNPPYDFEWSDASSVIQTTLAQLSDTVVGVPAGTYYLALTDANGCLAFDTVTLTVPPPLVVDSIASTDASCFGETDGTVGITVSGGTTPYKYLWSTGDSTSTVQGLAANTYSVTATDSTGCTVSDVITVSEPGEIIYTMSSTSASCNGSSDGTATINITGGGSGSFNYLWNDANSQATATATGLPVGSYSVVVLDAVGGCTVIDSVTVAQPDTFLITTTVLQDASCYNTADGQASADVGGVTTGYSFEWSSGEQTATATQLPGGVASVTVTVDSSGCVQSASVTINAPARFFLDMTSTPTSCPGGNDGTATVSVTTGGTPPFTASWSNGDASLTATNLVQDSTYYVTVTDASPAGCQEFDTVTITGPTDFVISGATEPAECFGNNTGSATVTVSGATAPYSYLWSNGSTTATADTLDSGTFSVTVTDANNCQDSLTGLVVTEPTNPLNIDTTLVNVSCPENTDGGIFITASGGTEPYLFSIDGGTTTQPNGNFATLSVGSYDIYVTDSNGCTFEAPVDIIAPPPFTVNFIPPYDSIILGETSVLQPIVEPYGSNYSYSWQPANTLNCDTCENPTAGPVVNTVYEVTVYDENNCQQSERISVYVVNDKLIYVPNAFTPNGDGLNDTWQVYAPGAERMYVKVFDRWGELVFNSDGPIDAKWDGKHNGKILPTDVFVYYIEVVYLDQQRTARKGSVTILK